MKSVQCVTFLLLAAAVFVDCYPQRDVESIEDDRDVPLPDVPAIAVPANPGWGDIPSFYSFFPDFDLVSRIRGLVTRLRSQIGDSFGEIDWSKGNTTSTTKVIDGHVVTVNETSYKDDDSDLVLHVKVIDVKPTEGAEEPSDSSNKESTTAKPLSNEIPTSTSAPKEEIGNEIPKQLEGDVAESLDNHPEESREHLLETREYPVSDFSIDEVDPINEVDNTVEVFQPNQPKPIDMEGDILINKMMSDKVMSGGLIEIPADVEVFEPDNRDLYETDVEDIAPNSRLYRNSPYSQFLYRPRSESLMSLR